MYLFVHRTLDLVTDILRRDMIACNMLGFASKLGVNGYFVGSNMIITCQILLLVYAFFDLASDV